MDAQEIKQLQELQNAYLSVYEAKKVDQDGDNDTDFADVRIARMVASGMSKAEAIAAVKNKEYNEEFEIDEAEKWIQKAIKKPGALHKQLGVPQGKNIPSKKLTAAAKEGGKLGRRARLAQTLSSFHNEEFEEIDEATRMRRELGKEGEIAIRKELARRSNAYQRSGSVDKTIAAAEREADRTTPRGRNETPDEYKSRMQKRSSTLNTLASNRRKSVRSGEGLRGYAAKVEGGDKDLQSARGSARSAGTLTPAEKKKLGEQYNLVLSYLLDEGYASNQESAEVIIENMSESWIESIVESLI